MPADGHHGTHVVCAAHLTANVLKRDAVDIPLPSQFDAPHVETPDGRIRTGYRLNVRIGGGQVDMMAERVILMADHGKAPGRRPQGFGQGAGLRQAMWIHGGRLGCRGGE